MDEQRKEVEAEDLEGWAKKVEGGDEVTIPKRRITDSLSPEEHKAYNADVEILIDLIHEHEVLNGGVPDKDLAKIIKRLLRRLVKDKRSHSKDELEAMVIEGMRPGEERMVLVAREDWEFFRLIWEDQDHKFFPTQKHFMLVVIKMARDWIESQNQCENGGDQHETKQVFSHEKVCLNSRPPSVS